MSIFPLAELLQKAQQQALKPDEKLIGFFILWALG